VRNDTSEQVYFNFSIGFDIGYGRDTNLGYGSGGARCLRARSKRILARDLRGNYIWIVPWQER
jgi:hypothetical protein